MHEKIDATNRPVQPAKERIISRQLLVLMAGVPGSGKSHFASRLEKELGAYRLNMDLLRGELFGTANRCEQREYNKQAEAGLDPPAIEKFQNEKRLKIIKAYNEKLSGNLADGKSVIIDASQHVRRGRNRNRRIAETFDIPSLLVIVQTPYELAVKRATERKLAADSYPFPTEEEAREEIDCYLAEFDYPTDDEWHVYINGEDKFTEQETLFLNACRQLADIETAEAGRQKAIPSGTKNENGDRHA